MKKLLLVLVGLAFAGWLGGSVSADPEFVRGNANNDAENKVDLGDVIFILNAIFVPGSPAPNCADAADANDDGAITISDPIYILLYLYCGGLPPPLPFPAAGVDPTEDELSCVN